MVSCSLCAAGKYSWVSNAAECHECPISTYSSRCAIVLPAQAENNLASEFCTIARERFKGRYAKPMDKCIKSIQFTTAARISLKFDEFDVFKWDSPEFTVPKWILAVIITL